MDYGLLLLLLVLATFVFASVVRLYFMMLQRAGTFCLTHCPRQATPAVEHRALTWCSIVAPCQFLWQLLITAHVFMA